MDGADLLHGLSRIGWGIVRPMNLIVLLLVLGPFLYAMGRRWLGRGLSLLGLAALISSALLPIGQSLLVALENRYPAPAALPQSVDGIVLLGGAVEPAITRKRGQPALNGAGERMTETLRLARAYPEARIVVTGGVPELFDGGLPETAVMERIFADQSVDTSEILFEAKARNTFENALYAKPLAQPKPGETWLLVTSAFHMPRAMGVFEAQGWPVLAFPTDFRTTGTVDTVGIDALRRIAELDLALKEWLGLAAYHWLGRTDALLPGPPAKWGDTWSDPGTAPPEPQPEPQDPQDISGPPTEL